MKILRRRGLPFIVPFAVSFAVSVFVSRPVFAETWDANVNLPPATKPAKTKTEVKPFEHKKREETGSKTPEVTLPRESERVGKPISDKYEPAQRQDGYWFRNRSDSEALIWVGGQFGFTTDFGGIGAQGTVNLKAKFGRCGPIAQWHSENIYIYDPADIHNSIYGAGLQCTIYKTPTYWRFGGGMHVATTLMAEYGTSTFHLYELAGQYGEKLREVRAQRLNGWGALAAGDLYFPLLYGFWLDYNISVENTFFDYDLSGVQGTKTDFSQHWVQLKVGFVYAF